MLNYFFPPLGQSRRRLYPQGEDELAVALGFPVTKRGDSCEPVAEPEDGAELLALDAASRYAGGRGPASKRLADAARNIPAPADNSGETSLGMALTTPDPALVEAARKRAFAADPYLEERLRIAKRNSESMRGGRPSTAEEFAMDRWRYGDVKSNLPPQFGLAPGSALGAKYDAAIAEREKFERENENLSKAMATWNSDQVFSGTWDQYKRQARLAREMGQQGKPGSDEIYPGKWVGDRNGQFTGTSIAAMNANPARQAYLANEAKRKQDAWDIYQRNLTYRNAGPLGLALTGMIPGGQGGDGIGQYMTDMAIGGPHYAAMKDNQRMVGATQASAQSQAKELANMRNDTEVERNRLHAEDIKSRERIAAAEARSREQVAQENRDARIAADKANAEEKQRTLMASLIGEVRSQLATDPRYAKATPALQEAMFNERLRKLSKYMNIPLPAIIPNAPTPIPNAPTPMRQGAVDSPFGDRTNAEADLASALSLGATSYSPFGASGYGNAVRSLVPLLFGNPGYNNERLAAQMAAKLARMNQRGDLQPTDIPYVASQMRKMHPGFAADIKRYNTPPNMMLRALMAGKDPFATMSQTNIQDIIDTNYNRWLWGE